MVKLDGRSKEARLIKARKQRKEIFKRIKQFVVEIFGFEFGKVLSGARQYYLLRSQRGYNDYWEYTDNNITENGILNHIRHVYTNYHDCLAILNELDQIPFTYRLKMGYLTEDKAYNWIKRKFNRIIKKRCYMFFEEFRLSQEA